MAKKMKRIIAALLLCASSLLLNAQKTSDKAIIKTPVQNCEKCKEIIEFFLSKTEGVTNVKVDLKKQTTTVTWLTERTDKETIKVVISGLGFAADDVEADESAYKRLPACCKKPVEAPKPNQ